MVGEGRVTDAFVKALWDVLRWDKNVAPEWNRLRRKAVMTVIDAAAKNMGIDMTNKENER
jgi:hypothetical protein